ncbi:hypothetical protein G7Z13_11235 [Streptomyces sp. JB150]|nr:hypothetical protein G7Z13_11235 [Streptomyces sp. JB150]
MTFILEGRDRLSRVLDRAGNSAKSAEKKLAAFGAAIPAAASIAPFAGAIAGAGVAVAAFGLAVGGQISHLSEASQAQKKYKEAVAEYGAASEQAATADLARQRTLAKMPPATREAAAALTVFKREYREYSDQLADDTMPVVTKSLGVFSALLPHTRGLVRGTSDELDRLMTVAGGGMQTPGFDRFMDKVERFAVGSVRKAVDGVVHLSRVSDTGEIGGGIRDFMDFAREQGPLVGDTLTQIATAAVHLLQAASGVGVGLLQVANAAAKVVASLPVGLITTLLQMAVAIRAVSLASRGLQLAAGAYAIVRAQIAAMGTAAIGASGAVGTLNAMFMALSLKARMAVAATGIGLLALALVELSQIGREAPPDVDRLTESLRQLGAQGRVTGEAAKAFGTDLDGLYGKVRSLTDPSTADKVQQFIVTLGGLGDWDSTPVKEAKENLDAIDKALAGLVKNGEADLAAAALKRLAAEYGKGGKDTKEFTKQLDEYKSALEDAKFEAELTAQSMGLFGKQAQQTQKALAAQKLSADGLRQSIQALNNVQRQGLGGMIAFEAAVDAAAQAAKDNAGALSMSGGRLNLNSEKARNAAQALNDLAARTDEAAAAARENGDSWSKVSGIYERGRQQLIKNAIQMGLTETQARQLADQILKTPNKTAMLRADISDWKSKISAAEKQLKTAKGDKKAKLTADILNWKTKVAEAEAQLKRAKGDKRAKLTADIDVWRARVAQAEHQLKTAKGSKRASLTANIADWQRKISAAQSQLASLPSSKTVTVHYRSDGANFLGPSGRYAEGGTPKAGELALVGEEGPELVVFGQAARVFDAQTTSALLNGTRSAGRLAAGGGAGAAGTAVAQGLISGMAGGTGAVHAAARRMAAAVTDGVKAELEIASPSKKTAALAKDIAAGFIKGLTGSRDKIKSVSKDLANDIRTAFSGKKERDLLRMVDRQTKKLLDYASKRDKIAARIAEAKAYAGDVTKTARDQSSLSNLGMDAEQVTAGGIKGGLAQKLSQIKQFTAYIKILAKRGLSKGLLRQILNMGPEAGYAYASALVGADRATFTQINRLQSQLDKSTTDLGRTGADLLYDSGKNAGKGFLKGLEGQKKSIEKLMIDIARGMQRAIKKALGIKSPSAVMAQLGVYSTEGLARGLVDGMPVLDRALGVVTGRVAAARPVIGRPAAGGGGATMIVHLHVETGPATDPHEVWRTVRKGLLQLKRDMGGGALGLA